MRPPHVLKRLAAVAALGAVAAGCESSTSATTARLMVRLTDKPLIGVQSATVKISRVYLVGGTDPAGPQYTISDTPTSYDLLTLQNNVTALLGTATIPPGDYSQLRLVVDDATLTLDPPLTFADGFDSRTMTVPSGQQTGIKVNFAAPVHVAPGETVLVVDFDVSRSFVFTGPASRPTGVLFKPVLHAVATDIAGSIAGTVTPASAAADLFAILQSSDDTVATASADANDGTYVLPFLPPGDYTVMAVRTANALGNASDTLRQTVTLDTAQVMTGVNFQF